MTTSTWRLHDNPKSECDCPLCQIENIAGIVHGVLTRIAGPCPIEGFPEGQEFVVSGEDMEVLLMLVGDIVRISSKEQ